VSAIFHALRGEGGEGRVPVLVFVHGFGCDHGDWEEQVAHFETRHRCVTLDLPGHGASPAGGEPVTIARCIDEVHALVAPMAIEAPVLLLGHSLGCRVALSVANRLGERAAGVVAVDGSSFAGTDPEGARAAMLAKLESAGFRSVAEGMFTQMFTSSSPRLFAEAAVARARDMAPEVGGPLLADMAAWDVAHSASMLDAVRVPLMAIQSTAVDDLRRRSVLAPGQGSPWTDAIAARVPGARIELLPGFGHFTMNEAPLQVNALVADFIASLESTGG
jgi:pimeloyl-ACP methyl ester carboxylesterase